MAFAELYNSCWTNTKLFIFLSISLFSLKYQVPFPHVKVHLFISPAHSFPAMHYLARCQGMFVPSDTFPLTY